MKKKDDTRHDAIADRDAPAAGAEGGAVRRVVMTYGLANTLLLTLSTASTAEAGAPRRTLTLPRQPGTVQETAALKAEDISVRQKGSVLEIEVRGKPGRHVGVFWGRDQNIDEFQPLRGAAGVIGKRGTVKLRANVGRLRLQKFFVGLGTASDPAFTRDLQATEIVEVTTRVKAAPRIQGLDPLRQGRQTAITRTVSMPSEGNGPGLVGKGGLGGLVAHGKGGGIGGLVRTTPHGVAPITKPVVTPPKLPANRKAIDLYRPTPPPKDK